MPALKAGILFLKISIRGEEFDFRKSSA